MYYYQVQTTTFQNTEACIPTPTIIHDESGNDNDDAKHKGALPLPPSLALQSRLCCQPRPNFARNGSASSFVRRRRTMQTQFEKTGLLPARRANGGGG